LQVEKVTLQSKIVSEVGFGRLALMIQEFDLYRAEKNYSERFY